MARITFTSKPADFASGKRRLVLQRHHGTFLQHCPAGTTGMVCCNYLVVNFASNCPYDCSYCFLQDYVANNPAVKIYTNVDEDEGVRLVQCAIDNGITSIDTADVYGWAVENGLTEETIGKWFAKGGGRRDAVVLATKVFNPGTGVFGQFAEIGVLGAWGTTFTNSNGSWTIVASPGVVPAPAAAALLGLAGLAGSRRRRG